MCSIVSIRGAIVLGRGWRRRSCLGATLLCRGRRLLSLPQSLVNASLHGAEQPCSFSPPSFHKHQPGVNKKQCSVQQGKGEYSSFQTHWGLYIHLAQVCFCFLFFPISHPNRGNATPKTAHLSWLAKSSSLASSSQLSSQTFTVVSSTPFDSASERKVGHQTPRHSRVFKGYDNPRP